MLVWFHGGDWQSGAGALDWYDGATLAREGDVVVVGVNYRLGPLGYLRVAEIVKKAQDEDRPILEVAAELTETESSPALPGEPRSPETLEQAVERHLNSFLGAHRDGMPVRDLYERVVSEVERPLIRLALAATRGNQIKAAAMLGLNRNTLRKKIRELELPVVRGLS